MHTPIKPIPVVIYITRAMAVQTSAARVITTQGAHRQTNAINFIDGLDGLAAGTASISSLSLLFISIFWSDYQLIFLKLVLYIEEMEYCHPL